MNRRYLASVALSFLLAACSAQDHGISEKIKTQVRASTTAPLNLTPVGPLGWERACIFGPYSTKEDVARSLGFDWDLDSHSSVSVNDGINLVVFVQGSRVLAHVDHRRGDGDFDSDKTLCTTSDRALLARSTRSDGIPLFTIPAR